MKTSFFFCFIIFSMIGFSQNDISKLLQKYNSESIPYISVETLQEDKSNIIFLDAREKKEFQVSHLKNAIYVGYDSFNLDSVAKKLTNKNSKIVVYCSLGIRSEDIGEKLKKAGYKNVFNLYGGIFEYKNQNLSIYNSKGKTTDSIHAYSKTWGKWLKNGIKIYD
ncbi:rhodanese-like domain-containing protein [Litoribaculum gwangyangense]